MKKEALLAISDVEIYPVISFVIYGLFFLAVLAYVIFISKDLVKNMKDLPLDDSSNVDLNNNTEHVKV